MKIVNGRMYFYPSNHHTDEEDDGSVYTYSIFNGKKIQHCPGDVVRPLTGIEYYHAIGGLHKNMNTVQAIWLNSASQIDPLKVTEALYTLSREVSLLQFCLHRWMWHLWFRRIQNFSIDFDSFHHSDPLNIYQELLSQPFDMTKGPLWRVRLVLLEKNTIRDKFASVLIFCIHHCISDSTTTMKLCRELVNLLNRMEDGIKISPMFKPVSPKINDILGNTFSLNFILKSLGERTLRRNAFLNDSFQRPAASESLTKVMFANLTADETGKLLKGCKSEGVTVHSCITSVINFALLKTAQVHSQLPHSRASIVSSHCVNMRRFFRDGLKDIPGCFISTLEQNADLSVNDAGEFWHFCRKVHTELKSGLEDGKLKKILQFLPLYSLGIFKVNKSCTSMRLKGVTDFHYLTSNMGDLKDLLPEPEKDTHIEIVDILRSVHCPFDPNPLVINFHTFRNRFMLSIDYFPNKIEDSFAKDFSGILITYLRRLAETGGILKE